MRIALTLISIALAAAGCTDAPVSQQVPAGSSITLTLTEFAPGMSPAFASTLGGPDPQRGEVRFVLCPQSEPGCVPADGYTLETTFMTRLGVDRTSMAGMSLFRDGALAVVDVPGVDTAHPEPGVYRLEPRLLPPNADQGTLLVPEERVQHLEIVPGEGSSTTFVDPAYVGYAHMAVPQPTVTFRISNTVDGAPVPVAGELRLRYPASVDPMMVAEADTYGLGSMVMSQRDPEDSVVDVRFVDATQGITGLTLAFALKEGEDPVVASEFSVEDAILYDANGAKIPNTDQSFMAPVQIR